MDWQPGCPLEVLRLRAQMLQQVRRFFAERSVLEVETPLLCSAIGTDPNLDFFTASYHCPPAERTLYLQTSPEFAMKRLLAAGSGSIYQICKAFRNGESGRFHNPEFTLLEWYRVGFNLENLMDEVADLMSLVLAGHPHLRASKKISYHDVFKHYTNLNPLVFCYGDYVDYVSANGLTEAVAICGQEHAVWLDFIFSHQVQPHLGWDSVCMVYGYPSCFSSLARINEADNRVTDRFELFIQGIEIGNGYFELADAEEQGKRFDRELAVRKVAGRPEPVKDNRLLAALHAGLPDCSGIAIGLDRLLMLLSNSPSIDGVLPFSITRA